MAFRTFFSKPSSSRVEVSEPVQKLVPSNGTTLVDVEFNNGILDLPDYSEYSSESLERAGVEMNPVSPNVLDVVSNADFDSVKESIELDEKNVESSND